MAPDHTLPLRKGGNRFSVVYLVAALALMFVALPFADELAYGQLVEGIVFTLVLLAAVSAVATHRWTLIVALVLAVPTLVARWVNHIWPELLPIDPSLVVAFVFVVFVIAHLLRYIIQSPVVDFEVLCAALAIYLLIIVAWSFVYTLIWRLDMHAFISTVNNNAPVDMSGFNAFYYSMQILSTITFGDIMPATNVARMLSQIEGITGLFYLATLISRLVGLYKTQPPAPGESQ
ncbi:MAG: potassium channel family protein [Pirellulales bacterium]